MAKYVVMLRGTSEDNRPMTRPRLFDGDATLDVIAEWVQEEAARHRFRDGYEVELRVEVAV